ncbi:MAG: TetR/AcrR family transcriptional regulator [Gemmatimonadota bacterium]
MRSSNSREPRTARGEATRQKLLDAAEALFGRGGYHSTSVTAITRRAGVAQGTFYLYFGGKEEVFRELVRDLNRRLRRAITRDVAGLESRLEVEEAGLRSFLRFAAEHRDLYRIVFESQFIDPSLFRWYYERLAEGYTRGLAAAMEAGEVRRLDPETVAYALMGAAHFMGMRWVVWENAEPPAEVLESLRRFIRSGLTAEPLGG